MSKLRIIDYFQPAEDRLCCNLCSKSYPTKTSHRAPSPTLLYDTIWKLSMILSVLFQVMGPKLRQPNELKFSPRCLLMYGRSRVWFMISSPQWTAYVSTRFLPAVLSGTQFNRNTKSFILLKPPSLQRWRSFGRLQKKRLWWTLGNCKKLGVGCLTVNVLFSRADFITLVMIRVWSSQKADSLLRLVTLRLEDFKLTWDDILAITTDSASKFMLKLGRLVQCEHIVCLSQALHLVVGGVLYEKCSHRTM